jgi:multidrug transporter EmrE-like cation transporter
MAAEPTLASQCIKLGAAMVCLWFAAVAFVLQLGAFRTLDADSALGLTLGIGSLLVFVVGIPLARDGELRKPISIFLLLAGAMLICALAALAALVFVLFLFSGSTFSSHN